MRTLLALVAAGVATGSRHLEDDSSLVQTVLYQNTIAADDAPNGTGPDGVPLVADGSPGGARNISATHFGTPLARPVAP